MKAIRADVELQGGSSAAKAGGGIATAGSADGFRVALNPSNVSHSGRLGPDTPSKASGSSSATRSRSGSTGPGITARPVGTRLNPARP